MCMRCRMHVLVCMRTWACMRTCRCAMERAAVCLSIRACLRACGTWRCAYLVGCGCGCVFVYLRFGVFMSLCWRTFGHGHITPTVQEAKNKDFRKNNLAPKWPLILVSPGVRHCKMTGTSSPPFCSAELLRRPFLRAIVGQITF